MRRVKYIYHIQSCRWHWGIRGGIVGALVGGTSSAVLSYIATGTLALTVFVSLLTALLLGSYGLCAGLALSQVRFPEAWSALFPRIPCARVVKPFPAPRVASRQGRAPLGAGTAGSTFVD